MGEIRELLIFSGKVFYTKHFAEQRPTPHQIRTKVICAWFAFIFSVFVTVRVHARSLRMMVSQQLFEVESQLSWLVPYLIEHAICIKTKVVYFLGVGLLARINTFLRIRKQHVVKLLFILWKAISHAYCCSRTLISTRLLLHILVLLNAQKVSLVGK